MRICQFFSQTRAFIIDLGLRASSGRHPWAEDLLSSILLFFQHFRATFFVASQKKTSRQFVRDLKIIAISRLSLREQDKKVVERTGNVAGKWKNMTHNEPDELLVISD